MVEDDVFLAQSGVAGIAVRAVQPTWGLKKEENNNDTEVLTKYNWDERKKAQNNNDTEELTEYNGDERNVWL